MKRIGACVGTGIAALAIAATPAWGKATLICRAKTFQGTIDANVIAEEGCRLANETTIEGNLTVDRGGWVAEEEEAQPGVTITGSLVGHEALEVYMWGGLTVDGSVRLRHTTRAAALVDRAHSGSVHGSVMLEDGVATSLYGLDVGGRVRITGNSLDEAGAFQAEYLEVGSNLEIVNNSEATSYGYIEVIGDHVKGDVRVARNTLDNENEASIYVLENEVGGNLQVNRDAATGPGLDSIELDENTVGEALKCEGDMPLPSGSGDTAASAEGQCSGL